MLSSILGELEVEREDVLDQRMSDNKRVDPVEVDVPEAE